MADLRRFLSMLGLSLLVLSTARPAQVQGPEEGWQVYTNANFVYDLALEGGGALGGGYTWVATDGGVVCYTGRTAAAAGFSTGPWTGRHPIKCWQPWPKQVPSGSARGLP
jgi:hypothetical protein